MIDCSILLVEDNPDDVVLIQRAFRKAAIGSPLHITNDGDQAVEFLSRSANPADGDPAQCPVLILLDLKLPRRNGLEVLSWLREQPALKRIPVVVLTSSREYKDVNRAYDLGANSYLLKPVNFDDFIGLIKHLNLYWLVLNERPDPRWAAGDD